MTRWTVAVPDPGAGWISANDRTHWAVRSRQVQAWRHMARWKARQAGLPRHLARVHVLAVIRPAHRRRRDVGNLAPTVKAIVDGLVDYGLIRDDDDAHLVGPDLRPGSSSPSPI